MAVIHISEADAARDFAQLMTQVRAEAEIVIEDDCCPAAILREGGDGLRPGLFALAL